MGMLARIAELLEKEGSFCLATILGSNRPDIRPGQKVIVRHKGSLEGTLGSTQLDSSLGRLAQKALRHIERLINLFIIPFFTINHTVD